MPRDLPAPTACKACPAMVRWALRIEGYKNIPLEVTPDPQGEWVAEWDKVLEKLLAVPFDFMRHHGRERYRSHLSRCRLPQPGPSSPAPSRPDPTAGLKFPRRAAGLWARVVTRPCVKCRERRKAGKTDPCHRCWREAKGAQLPAFPPLAEMEARRG